MINALNIAIMQLVKLNALQVIQILIRKWLNPLKIAINY